MCIIIKALIAFLALTTFNLSSKKNSWCKYIETKLNSVRRMLFKERRMWVINRKKNLKNGNIKFKWKFVFITNSAFFRSLFRDNLVRNKVRKRSWSKTNEMRWEKMKCVVWWEESHRRKNTSNKENESGKLKNSYDRTVRACRSFNFCWTSAKGATSSWFSSWFDHSRGVDPITIAHNQNGNQSKKQESYIRRQ